MKKSLEVEVVLEQLESLERELEEEEQVEKKNRKKAISSGSESKIKEIKTHNTDESSLKIKVFSQTKDLNRHEMIHTLCHRSITNPTLVVQKMFFHVNSYVTLIHRNMLSLKSICGLL
jgi:hypothetical protein